MHFASIYLLQKALLESLLWSKWPHFGRFLPYYGSKNSRKLLGKPPKTNQLDIYWDTRKYSKFEVHVCLRRSRRTRLFVWACSPAFHELPAGFAVQRQCYTGNHPKSCAGRPPARPALIKKKSLSRAGKVHKCTLPAFTCCKKHLGKPCLAQIRPILVSFGRFMGPKRLKNCGAHPPNIDKYAFWPIWRPFLSFYIDFQGNEK